MKLRWVAVGYISVVCPRAATIHFPLITIFFPSVSVFECSGIQLLCVNDLQVVYIFTHFCIQVLNLIPEEGKGETFEDALARVRRCIGGGGGDDNADSDSDIEVVADFFGVNLRCPVSY